MSFFLTSLNKLLNGIVPFTVMKLFQYRAKRAVESTWNASKGSWLLHRRGPRHRRKNSPSFTSLHCILSITALRAEWLKSSVAHPRPEGTGILWWTRTWNSNISHLVRHCRVSRTSGRAPGGHPCPSGEHPGGQHRPNLQGVTMNTLSLPSLSLMSTHEQLQIVQLMQ